MLVEGDQETFSWLVDAKRGNPENFKWGLPHPGGWHIMMRLAKALNFFYYGARGESPKRSGVTTGMRPPPAITGAAIIF